MIHRTPPLSHEDREHLAEIETIRANIRYQLARPARWTGTIRKIVQAEAVQSSTQIEGFVVSTEEALDMIAGRPVAGVAEATRLAVEDYQRAMNRVLALAADPHFAWHRGAVRDLHYLVTEHDPRANPGLWRTGPISVTGPGGRIVYHAADTEMVPGLMNEVSEWLASGATDEPLVDGAMAHFHVAAIHPFRDGNGRTARVLQSLVLTRAGRLAPAFASIERYLGDHTAEYYQALAASQPGRYDASSDVTPWIRFAIRAHRDEAEALTQRLEVAYRRRDFAESLVRDRSLPPRLATVIDAALLGTPVYRDEYAQEEGIARPTAIQDLRTLLGAGLLRREGGGRNIKYRATEELRRLYGEVE
jgi:Fic family protein